MWISVKDYVPKSKIHVLVFIPNEGISVKRLDQSIYSSHSDEIVWTSDDGEYENKACDVTHWMPLPLPPSINDEHIRDTTEMVEIDYDYCGIPDLKKLQKEYNMRKSKCLENLDKSLPQEKDDANSSHDINMLWCGICRNFYDAFDDQDHIDNCKHKTEK